MGSSFALSRRARRMCLATLIAVAGCGDAFISGPVGAGAGSGSAGSNGTGGTGAAAGTGAAPGTDGTPGTGGTPYVPVADCTDGVDCYCDRVNDPDDPLYDPDLAACWDWEDADAYEGDPTLAPSHQPGFRGGAAWWQQNFGAANGSCAWTNGEPNSPEVGATCAYGACAAAAWHPTNLWGGNDKACLQIQRNGDVASEIAGLTLSGGHSGQVWDGKAHMANRIRTDSPSALASRIAGPFQQEMGITMARAYSVNLLTANPRGNNGNWITQPWKGEQTTSGMQFPEGNTGPGAVNNPPFSGGTITMSKAACLEGLSGAETLIGHLQCPDAGTSVLRHAVAGPGDCDGRSNCDTTNEFRRANDWPLGTWGCVRAYWGGHGTDDAEIWVEFQGPDDPAPRRILHVRNIDSAAMFGQGATIGNYVFDAYYNANYGGPSDTPATETFFRYNDNLHLRHGEPVSCAQIGF